MPHLPPSPPSTIRTLSFPAALHAELAHGDRFARALRALYDDAAPDDPALLWLTGRSAEVTAFVDDVLREWLAGSLSSERASSLIEEYLATLHGAMEPWYGKWFAPSCCGPSADARASGVRVSPAHLRNLARTRQADTLVDEAESARTLESPAMSA